MSVERPEWVLKRLNGVAGQRPAPFWTPEEGDWICGTVVELGDQRSYFGPEPKPTMTIRVEAGTMRGVAMEPCSWARLSISHAGLAAWMRRESPQVGERVAVEYAGRVGTASGSYRHEYVAGVEREEGALAESGAQRW